VSAMSDRTAEKKIRALVVDDEELARQVLRELLQEHPEIQIVAECVNGFEAVKAISEHQPDLMFLDVQMPKLSGFDVLELIEEDVAVIFVTAYDQYAMKAFEVHAVDYLLKPIGRDRFEEALGRAKKRIGEKKPSVEQIVAAARPPQQYLERLVVRDGTRVTLIPAAKLDYVEAQDDYIALASQGAKHLKQQTIASVEAGLDPARFVRIHRSYIVNFERVVRIEPYGKDSRLAILADGTRLPVSRTGYARLKSLLDDRAERLASELQVRGNLRAMRITLPNA
jgi:two-component system LytT family response regulator